MDQKILQPLLLGPARMNQLQKPLLVIAMTDGAPAGENTDKSAYLITFCIYALELCELFHVSAAFDGSMAGAQSVS